MEEAITWFKLTKLPRWVLTFSDGGIVYGTSTEGVSPETAASELETYLRLFPLRKGFKIDASPSKDNADAKRHQFFIGMKDPNAMSGIAGPYGAYNPYGQGAFPPPPQPGVFTAEQVQKMIDDKVATMMKDMEIANLKTQLAALKGESPQTATDAAVATFVNGIGPYLPYLLFGHNPPVAGISGPRIEASEEDNTKMVAEAMQKMERRCEQLGISLPELLKKLADAGDKSPHQITMLNNMLSAG